MWFFPRRAPNQPKKDTKPTKSAQNKLLKRVEKIERGLKSVQMEWENTYSKLHATAQRLNRNARDAEKAETAVESTISEPTVSDFEERVKARRRNA